MFKGVFTAIVTPFKNDKIDYDKFGKIIEFQIKNGIDGIVPCGTTGESATLSHQEHKEIIEWAVKNFSKKIKIIAGTGSNNTKEGLELTEFAQIAGADGVLLITPYYNRPTQEGLYLHFKEIASKVPIPTVVYNVPSRTGCNILPPTIARLSEINNIVAVKEASGNLSQVEDIITLTKGKISVLSGDDALFYPIMALGGSGVISVVSNIVPKDVVILYKYFIEGKIDKAREMHYKLLPLIKAMFFETNPIPVKTAMAEMGLIENEIRLPLCEMSKENKEKLKKELKNYGLI